MITPTRTTTGSSGRLPSDGGGSAGVRLPSCPRSERNRDHDHNCPRRSALHVVAVIPKPALPPDPLAVAGGEVWIATEPIGSDAVRAPRRARSGDCEVLSTIDVTQEAVFSIAGDGDTCGSRAAATVGVPERPCQASTSARRGLSSRRRSPERRARARSWPVPPVVWLIGNGSSFALHLSPTDGHVSRASTFPAHACSGSGDRGAAASRRRARRRHHRGRRS